MFLGTFVAAFLALLPQTTDFRLLAAGLGAIAIAALIQVIVESVRSNRAMVRIDLDVSRRWVTSTDSNPRPSRRQSRDMKAISLVGDGPIGSTGWPVIMGDRRAPPRDQPKPASSVGVP